MQRFYFKGNDKTLIMDELQKHSIVSHRGTSRSPMRNDRRKRKKENEYPKIITVNIDVITHNYPFAIQSNCIQSLISILGIIR